MDPRTLRVTWRCLTAAVIILSLSSLAARTAAGPLPDICCVCSCPAGATMCEQVASDLNCVEVCNFAFNQTCSIITQTNGTCLDVPVCGVAPPATAPTMGTDAMAVLAGLLGVVGVLRLRRRCA